MKNPKLKGDKPVFGSTEERQQKTSDFIKMKRAMMKQQKTNESLFTNFKGIIDSGDTLLFEKEFNKMAPKLALNFLFAEDELKMTHYSSLVIHPKAEEFLKIINTWTELNKIKIDEMYNVEENQMINFNWKQVYSKVLKVLVTAFSGLQEPTKDFMILLGKKDSIFFQLSTQYLNLDQIIIYCEQSNNQSEALDHFFKPLLTKTDLSEMNKLSESVTKFILILERDQLWKDQSFGDLLLSKRNFDSGILQLKELKFNFWHQLALKNPSQFLRIASDLSENAYKEQVHTVLTELSMEINNSGETPFDTCLRLWEYKNIKQLMLKYQKIPEMILSSNSLLKILKNRKLSQSQKEQLMLNCLSQENGDKGYAKIIQQKYRHCFSRPLNKSKFSSYMIDKEKAILINSLNYTFSIVYSSNTLKIAQDPSGFYPLTLYLNHYKEKANLKVIEALWLTVINKKDIKKLYHLFKKEQKSTSTQIDSDSNAFEEFKILYEYYQPLWKIITSIAPGNTLDYIIGKCYLNVQEIKVLKRQKTFQVTFFGHHFLRTYLQRAQSLKENPQNQAIIESILHCKEKEKKFGDYQLFNEILKSVSDISTFHNSQQYLPSILRKQLKAHLNSFTIPELIECRKLWQNQSLLGVVVKPQVQSLISKTLFVSLEDIVEKIGEETMRDYIREDNLDVDEGEEGVRQFSKDYLIQKLYTSIFKKTKRSLPKADLDLSYQTKKQIQILYLKTDLEETNDTFIAKIEKRLKESGGKWVGDKIIDKTFKLRPDQHHLQSKMSAFAQMALDTYFSKYTKRELFLKDISDESWKNILTRMYNDRCTFFAALLTEPTATFEKFKFLFENQNKTHMCKFLLKLKIQDEKAAYDSNNYFSKPPYFFNSSQGFWNIDFLIDLLKFYQETEVSTPLGVAMAENVDKYLKTITKMSTEKKETTEQLEAKQHFQSFIKRTIPIISQLGSSEFENQEIFEQIILPLLINCHQKRLTQHCKTLLQVTDYQLIYTHDLSLQKLTLFPETRGRYIQILSTASATNFRKWINTFSHIHKQNSLNKCFTKFDMGSRFELLSNLANRYSYFSDSGHQEEEGDSKIPQKIFQMILLVLKTVPMESRVDTYLKLATLTSEPLLSDLNHHKRSLLMSAHDVSNTTAALILLDNSTYNSSYDKSKSELVFYLKEDKAIKKYTQEDFYAKSSENHFKVYVANLEKYHGNCKDINQHLQNTTFSLLQAQQWQKLTLLLKIKPLQKLLVQKVFINMNKSADRQHLFKKDISAQLRDFINSLFQLYQELNLAWKEDIFRAAFFLDYKKALKIMLPPSTITLATFVQCLKFNPQSSQDFLKLNIRVERPPSYCGTFPLRKHYVHDVFRIPWLVDELRLQNKVCSQKGEGNEQVPALNKVKKAWMNQKAIMPFLEEFYPGESRSQLIVRDILKNKNITDLAPYEKVIPNMRQLIKIELFSCTTENIKQQQKKFLFLNNYYNFEPRFANWSQITAKKGPCISLKTISKQLLTLFIKENLLSAEDSEKQLSVLIRVIDNGDFDLIELYSQKSKLSLTRDSFDRIGFKLDSSFLNYLFGFSNENFLLSFLKKYNILESYSIHEWSPPLLNSICKNRFNQVMQFVISHVTSKYHVVPTFAAEVEESTPKITQTGAFYLPVTLAKEFNFYQCYFLIKQSHNLCPPFEKCSRFLSIVDDTEYAYIPEFQRRIKINNSIITHFPQSRNLHFRNDILMQALFELEGESHGSMSYEGSFMNFLKKMVNRNFAETDELQNEMGIFQKLTLMMLTSSDSHIPLHELQKKNPSEMKVLKNLHEYFQDYKIQGDWVRVISHFKQYKPLLLEYNAKCFLENREFRADLQERSADFIQYLRGIQVNVENVNEAGLLTTYIERNFFSEDEKISLFSATSSLTLKRETLILLLIDLCLHNRQWQQCVSFKTMMRYKNWADEKEEYVLYLLAHHMNYMTDTSVFDLSLWNKIISIIDEVQLRRTELKMPGFTKYPANCLEQMINHYSQILKDTLQDSAINTDISNIKTILEAISKKQLNNHGGNGILLQLTLLMNIIFLKSQCCYLGRKLEGFKKETGIGNVSLMFGEDYNNKALFKEDESEKEPFMKLQVKLTPEGVVGAKQNKLLLFLMSLDDAVENAKRDLYFLKLKKHPQLNDLNAFCEEGQRHQFFKNYKFIIDVNSFKRLENYSILTRLFEKESLNGQSIFAKTTYDIQNMEERLEGFRNTKLYNMSDLYGPINFHEQTNNNKIIDCLTFYELLPLPKQKPINIRLQNPPSPKERNQQMIQYLEKYFAFYINSSRDEPADVNFDNEMLIWVKEDERGVQKIQLSWDCMAAWTIADLTQKVLSFNSKINQRIEHVLDVRISFLSLLDHYKAQLSQSLSLGLSQATEKLLSNSCFNDLLQSILMMITEDIKNIMNLVKGIIVRFELNKGTKQVANVILSENTSINGVAYEVRQNLLYMTFHMKVKNGLNQGKKSEEVTKLVSRREFLDSVFVSTQFLTDYFLVKGDLDRECLNIGTAISKKINARTHLHLQYNQLYAFIDEMRKKQRPIKDMESLLSRIKHYLVSSMDRVITQYLGSQQLANKHQVMLMDKCQAINTGISLEEVQKASELIYNTRSLEPVSGLKDIQRIMSQIGSDQFIKNSFLIQIYKSYYSALVAQGMTFLVGYQSSSKKAQVVTIRKAENINQINVVELDFLLLVSKSIPSQDEINHNKIIRIFVTDNNRNLYKMNFKLQKYMLNLPEDSENRNMSTFAPIIPSDLTIVFKQFEKDIKTLSEKETKEKKVFFVELPPLDQIKKGKKEVEKQYRLKLKPVPEKPLSPVSLLKKSVIYKEGINKLANQLVQFTSNNMKIIIDPPAIEEMTLDMNLDNIINLVCTDLIETFRRLEYDLMRVPALDCKLAVQRGINLNYNAIVQLRKRKITENYKTIRLKLRPEKRGVTFDKDELIINIPCGPDYKLSTVDEYLSVILSEIVRKQIKSNPIEGVVYMNPEDLKDNLFKAVDILNLLEYQREELNLALTFIKNTQKVIYYKPVITFETVKSKVLFEKDEVRVRLNVQSIDRDFYTAEQIIQAYFQIKNQNLEINEHLKSRYEPSTNSIHIFNSASSTYKLYQCFQKNIKQLEFESKKGDKFVSGLALKVKPTPGSRYLLLDDNFSCVSNYFFEILDDKKSTITSQKFEGFINQDITMYLLSETNINLNKCSIIVTKTDPLNKDNKIRFELVHPTWKSNIKIFLIDYNTLKLVINSPQSTTLKVSPSGEGWSSPFCRDSTAKIVISSEGQMNLNCTKFTELQVFKKKPVSIKQKNLSNHNIEFKETSEIAEPQIFMAKVGEETNIQNLVYVINDDCKRYLTRAGEPRIDYIQLCDSNHNPINFSGPLNVKFVHINKLAVIEPEISRRDMQHGLKWTPVIKGHYYLYINNFLMNPTYEIGVCAAQADHKVSTVTPPKVVKLCFCQQSEIMLDLRDSFKNIYSQLQQQILGDELLIELVPDKLQKYLKIQKSPINKYGLKKVKFNFNYTEGQEIIKVEMKVLLNCEEVLHFVLQIEGYSLKQRKKLLDQDINSKDKRYYKELVINRSKFLENIMMHAEKSLMTNLSIKFYNEPGIDAGGVKRQFYDLIGNEMKSEKNPFFRLVNNERMEYFLNSDLLKNKKKEEYMEVWGKYLANSILNTYLIGMSFSPVFVKMLYGQQINYEDLLEVSTEDERKQYSYLLTASPDQFEDLCLFFTAVVDKKKAKEVELKAGGKDIQVTAQNVKEYLELTAQELLTKRYETTIEAFRKGFNTVIELDIIKKWIRPHEFWSLTAGTKEITPEIVLNYVTFGGSNIQIISGWFRRYITEATRQIMVGFLKFSSGSSSIDFSLTSKITVTFQNAGENPKKLPISHTCWKQIVVPKYKSYEIMQKLLNAAFIYCSEGFGFG